MYDHQSAMAPMSWCACVDFAAGAREDKPHDQ
jgi:hypothetical protein